MRTAHLLAAAALAACAAPASATIVLGTAQQTSQGQEVLLAGAQSGSTITGLTNQTNTSVTLSSGLCAGCLTQTLDTPSSGQARIEATGSLLGNLTIALTDPTLTFGYIEFNLFEHGVETADSVTITGLDTADSAFTQSFGLKTGSNWFDLLAQNGESISSVAFTIPSGGVTDIRQVRIGDVQHANAAAPEPATWALVLLGFGAVGFSLRRRRKLNLPQLG